MYRAERLDGLEKVEGDFITTTLSDEITHWITDGKYSGVLPNFTEVKPETLEIYLFGEWRLVSELETKYKLVEV